MSIETIAERVLMLIPVWLSLTVHEFAHAWSAFKLGDNTARERGRLTLNPIAHIDPIGTLLLPLLGVPFGWARPVPVNPARFERRFTIRQGMLITAAAGPISNLLLALASTVLLGVLLRFAPGLIAPSAPTTSLFLILINVNVALALFNLLPILPLDGGKLLGTITNNIKRTAMVGMLLAGVLALVSIAINQWFTMVLLGYFAYINWQIFRYENE